ncbi:hypothetical protein OOZ15_11510 [Galbibacter sp. EGI 63066]|uniref:hypothetical protein n=1 Tax=Galbibacter sp. EGI 63066 TaxID=2993559 RepID=UPI0022488797|nr:hypothetical protein [Galbibacter sp. EGI 63066]MCX2680569.1 hypothetical protein [Galbibacter sp. EGI 63066]
MRFLLFILFIGVGITGYAQKEVRKSISVKEITFVQVDAENVFEVVIDTHKADQIIAEAFMEGEYQNELMISLKEEGTTLWIGTEFRPSYANPNDKLSAHKVLSVALHITLPEHMELNVQGKGTTMKLSGNYKELKAVTNSQWVFLKDITGAISVKTIDGDILTENIKGKMVADSKYGTVNSSFVKDGHSYFELNSVNGDIYINKKE